MFHRQHFIPSIIPCLRSTLLNLLNLFNPFNEHKDSSQYQPAVFPLPSVLAAPAEPAQPAPSVPTPSIPLTLPKQGVSFDNSVTTTVAPIVNIKNDAPVVTVTSEGYDSKLSADQRKLIRIGYNAAISAALAYMFSEDYIYYGALGGIISVAKQQSDKKVDETIFDGVAVGGGVALSYILRGSYPIKSVMILGVGRVSEKLLP